MGEQSRGPTDTEKNTMNNSQDKVKMFVCTAFWFGRSPVAPGTVGTLPAVIIFAFIAFAFSPFTQTLITALFFILFCGLSIFLGPWAERHWKRKDPRPFVLDEVASFFLTVLLFRVPSLLLTIVWAFVMTRIFDIIKPFPAKQMESLPAGWGILLDDLVASVYAAAVLHLAMYFIPSLFAL